MEGILKLNEMICMVIAVTQPLFPFFFPCISFKPLSTCGCGSFIFEIFCKNTTLLGTQDLNKYYLMKKHQSSAFAPKSTM